jgi:putative PIN family toxin of toxin-antitoxin system
MTSEDRQVVDTNVAVSGILFQQSIPGRALDRVLESTGLLHSNETLAELRGVLARERFDRYVSRAKRDEFLLRITKCSSIIVPTETITACRDPDDDQWLELAVAGDASGIITGDQDLLVLHPFRGIPILTPADYLATNAP